MEDSQNLLFKTVSTGNVQEVKNLLIKGLDPNCTRGEGYSPLAIACRNGDEKTMYVLLRANADPNLTNVGILSPLTHAIKGGNVSIVRALLEANASPFEKTHFGGNFPLIIKAENYWGRNSEITNLLRNYSCKK